MKYLVNMKNTFLTQSYRGSFIQSYCENDLEIIHVTFPDGEIKCAKSFRGAKQMISRQIGGRIYGRK